MNKIHIRKAYYHVRHNYFTMNNIVLAVALLVALGWVWGSVQAMERNYGLEKELDAKRRALELTQLETELLKYEQNYFQSDEYKELSVRERLGLALPGEKVLILPPNSSSMSDEPLVNTSAPAQVVPSNMQQWVNFLFGGASESLKK